jgi:hypothetical protein
MMGARRQVDQEEDRIPKYVLAYYGGGMPETPEEQAKVMQAWGEWFGQLGSALADGGNPTSGAAKTISPDGTVKDGANGAAISGYSIIDAPSLDKATELASGCPVLEGGAAITVLETLDVMAAAGANA